MSKILYEGKSKAVCEGTAADNYIIRYKDDATAFNGEKKETLAGKGRLNAEISNLIFKFLAENGIETHLIEVIDEDSILVKKAEIIMVEIIVRNVAAGSFSKKYGVEEGTALNHPTTEFSLKSDSLGDPMINSSQITALGIAALEELSEMTMQTLRVNDLLTELFGKAGIRLVDFKLEFGRYDGRVILCDEISPDSCRLWEIGTDKKLDKDRFRRDMGEVLDSYREVLRRLKDVL